jgi:predicted esterase
VTAFSTHGTAATTHGRYLLSAPADGASDLVLVGFHGYAEAAEVQLERLSSFPGAERAVLVSIQGLHRFYRGRSTDVVASWMTRQDRELAIADNLSYIDGVLQEVTSGLDRPSVVFCGFSQGGAMALRAACASTRRVGGVIVLGNDIPPELDDRALGRLPAVLIGRGARDSWYTAEKMTADLQRLRTAGVAVDEVVLDAGHEWTAEFSQVAGKLLAASRNR